MYIVRSRLTGPKMGRVREGGTPPQLLKTPYVGQFLAQSAEIWYISILGDCAWLVKKMDGVRERGLPLPIIPNIKNAISWTFFGPVC